jgi:hypothetical protein
MVRLEAVFGSENSRVPEAPLSASRLMRCSCRFTRSVAASRSTSDHFKPRLSLQRSQVTKGIMEEDRHAMLLDAQRLALDGIDSYPNSKFSYQIYGDVGIAMARRHGETHILDDAIAQMEGAIPTLLDPELENGIRTLQRVRREFPT